MFNRPFGSTPLDLRRHLSQIFGYQDFRHGQREIIEAVMAGRDVLGVMPTGQGKSLCFQFPATLAPGLTVVVSPLIALMKDQRDALRARGIAAGALHSGMSQGERDRVIQDMRLGRLTLLYLAPERLQHHWFIQNVRRSGVALLVVDEAHCISHWGHDFRPDYRRLSELRAQLDAPPCLALTATATPAVQRDIVEKLRLRDPVTVITGFRRPNLSFTVRVCHSKDHKLDELDAALRGMTDGTALIYCATRRHVEELAATLRGAHGQVGYYHAGLADELRVKIHEEFRAGGLRILVATNAFGMGIDKPDIRLVVHYDVPGSLEAYYQEAGRAGRDSRPATCLLLFQHTDVGLQEFFIQKAAEEPLHEGINVQERQQVSRTLLQSMVDYAYADGCRQERLLAYFGDEEERRLGACHVCDRCRQPPLAREHDPDLQRHVITLMGAVARYNGRYGMNRLIDILYGSTAKAVTQAGLHTTEWFGTLRTLGKSQIGGTLQRLIASGYVAVDGLEWPVLRLTTKGAALLRGEPLVWTDAGGSATGKTASHSAAPAGPLTGRHHDLYERLRRWRLDMAKEEGVAPFVVFHDKTLRSIAALQPQSLAMLESVPGMGPAKLDRYGRALLKVVEETAN